MGGDATCTGYDQQFGWALLLLLIRIEIWSVIDSECVCVCVCVCVSRLLPPVSLTCNFVTRR